MWYNATVGICRISIHAAREGGDLFCFSCMTTQAAFQSTPPVKAATFENLCAIQCTEFQSTPPVKAATVLLDGEEVGIDISIHAAREGGDHRLRQFARFGLHFNPRRP